MDSASPPLPKTDGATAVPPPSLHGNGEEVGPGFRCPGCGVVSGWLEMEGPKEALLDTAATAETGD